MRSNICISCSMVVIVTSLSFSVLISSDALAAAAPPKPAPAKPAAPVAPPKAAPVGVRAGNTPPPAEEYNSGAAEEVAEPEKEEDPIDLEISFMKSLVRVRMPDYAQKALDKLIATNPEAKARASIIKIDILAGVGHYDEAEKLIASMPPEALETWTMKLALAEHYYSASMMEKAKAGYGAFFKKYEKGPPPGMQKFYMEQAYKYAQMLMFKNEEKEAVDAFLCVLIAQPEKDIEYKIRIDLAELCIKLASKSKDKEREEFFKKAKDACEPVLWRDSGPMFGKALMILAHMEMIKGDKKAAKKLIDTYMPMLKEFEKVLKQTGVSLDFSPMAECRYMLGSILEEDGLELLKKGSKKEGIDLLTAALQHFVNVGAKYQSSQWALPAGEAQERVVVVMKQNGFDPKIPPFNKSKLMESVLKEAQNLFEQNLFQDAAKKYMIYANTIPEQETSVAALGELTKCYIELGNTNMFDIVAGYVGERFGKNPQLEDNAGNALLRAASCAGTLNNKELQKRANNYYVRYCPTHRRMANVLFQYGTDRASERNYDQAIDYFLQITTNAQYAKSVVYFPALGKLAHCYSMMNDFSNAVQVLTKTIADLQPGVEEIETRYRLGDIYRRMDKVVPAINEFVAVINAVNGSNKVAYARTAEDVTKAKSLMESVYFWKAYCYAMLNKPVENIPAYQQKAITDFTKFVADYPKSPLSSTALSKLGSLLYATGKSDEASKIFDRLVKEYPDAPESKDVVFVQGMSLIEMKKMDKAKEVFGRMFENEKAFDAAKFLRVGKIMSEAGEYTSAIKFFERSKALATKGKDVMRAVWEPAMYGIGDANYKAGNSADAVKALEELFARFKKSPLFVESCFVLSKAYADLGSKEKDPIKKKGLFINSRATIAKALTAITDPVVKFKANLQIADVQLLLEEKGQAAASYDRMLSFGDWNNADMRPHMEEAVSKGLPLIFEKEMYEKVINIATSYLAACPRGKYVREAGRMLTTAKLKMAMSGQKMSTDSGAAPEVAPATPAVTAPAAAPAAPAAVPAAAVPAAPVKATPVAAPAAAVENKAVAPVAVKAAPKGK